MSAQELTTMRMSLRRGDRKNKKGRRISPFVLIPDAYGDRCCFCHCSIDWQSKDSAYSGRLTMIGPRCVAVACRRCGSARNDAFYGEGDVLTSPNEEFISVCQRNSNVVIERNAGLTLVREPAVHAVGVGGDGPRFSGSVKSGNPCVRKTVRVVIDVDSSPVFKVCDVLLHPLKSLTGITKRLVQLKSLTLINQRCDQCSSPSVGVVGTSNPTEGEARKGQPADSVPEGVV